MERYLMLSLGAVGALFMLGVSLLRGSINGVRADIGAVSKEQRDGMAALTKEQGEQSEKLVRIETILTGADGTNGLNGEVKQLRARSHTHGDAIHAVNGKLQAHELRLDEMDRRTGPTDRRHSA